MLLLGTVGCRKDESERSVSALKESNQVPLAWYRLLEQVDRYSTNYRPPASSRMFGYLGLAGYEAAVPGMPGFKSLGGHYPGLFLPSVAQGHVYDWPTAVNAAYHRMLVLAYPHIRQSDKDAIQALYLDMLNARSWRMDPEVIERSDNFGDEVAKAVFDWSKTDLNGHDAFLDPFPVTYQPPQGPGLWQPSWPDFTKALFPYWGQVRPFAMSTSDLLAKPPLIWSEDPNSAIHRQAQEVFEVTEKVRNGLDEEGRWIAEFWSDDFEGVTFTPPCRFLAIANQVAEAEQISLGRSVELYARLGMSMADAAIAVWNSKYFYNYERPIQYIRRNFDANWKTTLNHPLTGIQGVTPPFPTYPSGHSGFAGAGGGVLAQMFGNEYTLTDRCHESRTEFLGAPRTFHRFTEMAQEDAYSRIPLGVHFRMDCDEGLRLGHLAAQRVQQLPWH